MRPTDEEEFRRYAVARTPVLLRTAYLLCGDWHRAEDIVSTAVVKLYVAWPTASRADNLNAYVRQIVVRSWLDERRRPWRRERPSSPELLDHHSALDVPGTTGFDLAGAAADRVTLWRALATMPARQRAVLVLRYYEDLSIEQTAQVLRCSSGAVKSMTHRALDTLRGLLPEGTVREAR